MINLYTVIIRLLDVLTNILIVVGGLLVWLTTGFLIYILFKFVAIRMAMSLVEVLFIIAFVALILAIVVPPFIAFGYFLIHMGIKATFQKVLEGKGHEVSNAYLVYSTVLDKASLEPLVDIFFASDRIKAEELFLREYPNAVETLIKSELIDAGVKRAEGMLRFDLEDELYWELWDLVGDGKILGVIKDAEANSGC